VEVLFDRICRENGISHRHTAVRSPTTTGKIERFHQSLRKEFLDGRTFVSVDAAQAELDRWVTDYNTERPHQALDMATPAQRFGLRPLAKDKRSVAVDVGEDHAGQWVLRRVASNGVVSVDNQMFSVGNAFKGVLVDVFVDPTTIQVWSKNHLIKTVARARWDRCGRSEPPPFTSTISRIQNVKHQLELDTPHQKSRGQRPCDARKVDAGGRCVPRRSRATLTILSLVLATSRACARVVVKATKPSPTGHGVADDASENAARLPLHRRYRWPSRSAMRTSASSGRRSTAARRAMGGPCAKPRRERSTNLAKVGVAGSSPPSSVPGKTSLTSGNVNSQTGRPLRPIHQRKSQRNVRRLWPAHTGDGLSRRQRPAGGAVRGAESSPHEKEWRTGFGFLCALECHATAAFLSGRGLRGVRHHRCAGQGALVVLRDPQDPTVRSRLVLRRYRVTVLERRDSFASILSRYSRRERLVLKAAIQRPPVVSVRDPARDGAANSWTADDA
jgi:hypothetical protein